jgi:hypothetical protein
MAAGRPGDAFAIGNDEQYRPVRAVGGQRVPVGGPEGTGRLACHASRPLRGPWRGPVVIVVHGALRDSDRYLASAQHAARLACSDALIVAPQFLADVDRAAGDRAAGDRAGDALYWQVEGWKGGYPALGRERPVAVPAGAPVNDWRYGFDRAPGYVDADPRRSLERYRRVLIGP